MEKESFPSHPIMHTEEVESFGNSSLSNGGLMGRVGA